MKEDLTMKAFSLSAYTTPNIVEDKRKEFVSYGDDNDYFTFLINRFQGSTTNNAIITGMNRAIYGKGVEATDRDEKPLAYDALKELFKPNDLRRFISDRKMLGMAALKITRQGGRVVKVSHFPMNTLRSAKADENGEVTQWLYHPNWVEYQTRDVLKDFPAFGYGKANGEEMYVLKPYAAGSFYYTPCDYMGSLPYAVLEEEIGDYLINDTINGFSGTKVINFNNGQVDDVKKRNKIVQSVKNTITGTKGQKVLISFNNSKENAMDIQDLSLNDAPSHYEYLADECFRKLVVGHRVTSPMLLGVRDGNSGLGNNADEIKNANLLFDNYVIKHYQSEISEVINEILLENGFELDLYFKTIEPLEFIDIDSLEGNEEEIEKELGVSEDVEMSRELSKALSEENDTNVPKEIKSRLKGFKWLLDALTFKTNEDE